MSRKHLRLIANGIRVLLLAVCCAAGGTAAVWNWRPDWVARLDDWFVHRYVAVHQQRLSALHGEPDLPARTRGYQALATALAAVRRQDRLAPVRADCLRLLSQLAEARADVTEAIGWQRELALLMDHDVAAAARLAELQCRLPSEQQSGLEGLRQLAADFPGHPVVVNSQIRGLCTAERPADAATALATAMGALRSNLWTVAWDAGAGIDRQERRVEVVPGADGKGVAVRFSIAEPIKALALFAPAFHSGVLLQPRLETADGRTIDLTGEDHSAFQMRTTTGRALTTGDSGPSLTARWTTPIPANTDLVLRWQELPLPELAYAEALLEPALSAWLEGGAAGAPTVAGPLRRWRAGAAACGTFQLFWSRGDEAITAARSRTATTVPVPSGAGSAFALAFEIAGDVDRLRLDLPEGLGVQYALAACDVTANGATTRVDPAQVELLTTHGVERRAGVFVVTGKDPHFTFALGAILPVDRIAVAGVAQ